MNGEMRKLSNVFFSVVLFLVGLAILIPALVITLLAASLIVVADDYFTKEIKHKIKWRIK